MRYLELEITDLPDDGDAPIRTRPEWIHRDHIETIEPYLTDRHPTPMLWLELTLTSGRTRYVPVGPTSPAALRGTAAAAISDLLEQLHPGPVAAAR